MSLILKLKRDSFGRFIDNETKFVFNRSKDVIGKGNDDGTISPLTEDDKKLCIQLKFDYTKSLVDSLIDQMSDDITSLKLKKNEVKTIPLIIKEEKKNEEDDILLNRIEQKLKDGTYYMNYFKPSITLGNIKITKFSIHKNYNSSYTFDVHYYFIYNNGNLSYSDMITKTIMYDPDDQKEENLKKIKNEILRIKKFKICLECFDISEEECKCEKGFSDDYYIRHMLEIKNEDVCSICLSEIEDLNNSAYFHSCKNHFYHLGCLTGLKKAECPMCKQHCHSIIYKNKNFNLDCQNCEMCDREEVFDEDEE